VIAVAVVSDLEVDPEPGLERKYIMRSPAGASGNGLTLTNSLDILEQLFKLGRGLLFVRVLA
jgi:hypothetical protein